MHFTYQLLLGWMRLCYCTQKQQYFIVKLFHCGDVRLTKISFHNQDVAFVPKAIDLSARELTSPATPGQVDQTELDCSKASAKSAILMNLESEVCVLGEDGASTKGVEDCMPE